MLRLKYFQLNRSLFASGYVGKIKARFGKINAPHHGMYHLGAVPAEFTLIHGRFGQPEKNPPQQFSYFESESAHTLILRSIHVLKY